MTNDKIKSRLIMLLSVELRKSSISALQPDADTLIVQETMKIAAKCNTGSAVIGEDIDLLVLLIALTPVEVNMFFIKSSKGKKLKTIYDMHSIWQYCTNIKRQNRFGSN